MDVLIEFSGVVAIIITAITTFIVQNQLKRIEKNNNFHDDFRKRKHLALEELSDILNYNSEKIKIISFPKNQCEARFLNKNHRYIMTTAPDLENLEYTKTYVNKLNTYCVKNQVYLDSELIKRVSTLIAYFNNYIYYCELGNIEPNKLTSLLLRDDISQLGKNIVLSIRRSYSNLKIDKKAFPIDLEDEKSRAEFKSLTSDFNLLSVAHFKELDLSFIECGVDWDYAEKIVRKTEKHSELYIHANLCKNCNLKCELAGLYFARIEHPTFSYLEKSNE